MQTIGGHTVRGKWMPVQAILKNPQPNKKAYYTGAALSFGATIHRNWDTIRPVAAGIVGAGATLMATGNPGLAARGGYAAVAATI